MAFHKQRALVTGGAGFIGSHIAEALISNGSQVTVLDNLSSGREENLNHLQDEINFIKGDIRDDKDLTAAIKDCDLVFHQAAVVSVTQTVSDPLESADVNEFGTLKVLEAARDNGVRRVVLASSSAVYGDDPQLPKLESMPCRPLSPYAVQKYTNEQYARLYHHLYGLETVCLRYFNVYGPRQDPSSPYSGVISIFMTCAASDAAPTIYGDGGQTRDFVFVNDVVRANLLAAEAPDAAGRVFNVGTGVAIAIKALWQKISRLATSEQAPTYADARRGDIVHSVAGIEHICRILDFSPSVSFDEGLAQTFAWYQGGGL
jgi:UDP-glucose 4-epimerase